MEQDKKDILEKKLKSELEDFQITPPADMWERISATLAGQQSGQNSEELSDQPVQRQITLRRPARKKMAWTYATAAGLLLGMVLIGYTFRTVDNYMATDDFSTLYDPFGEQENKDPEKEFRPTMEVQDGLPARTSAEIVNRSSGKISDAAAIVVAHPQVSEPGNHNPEPGTPATGTAGSAHDTEHYDERNPETEEKNAHTQQYITSDMKGRGGSVYPERAFAEEFKRTKRRTAPVSTSLYAANIPGNSNGSTVVAGTRLSSSTLAITEISAETASGSSSSIYREQNITTQLKHRLPVGFGGSISFGITERLWLGTGIIYTRLISESEGGTTDAAGTRDYRVSQKLHYVGIPLNVKYDIFTSNRFSFYGAAGGTIEKMVSGKYTQKLLIQNQMGSSMTESLSASGFQTSVNATIGAELRLYDALGLYAEPGVSYYFKNSNQPESYRWQHPANFTLRIGLRYSFGKK